MMDLVNGAEIARPCHRKCGEFGFCHKAICYWFPNEEYGYSTGVVVKNRQGQLQSCKSKTEGGLCREIEELLPMFPDGILISPLAVCQRSFGTSPKKAIDCTTTWGCAGNYEEMGVAEDVKMALREKEENGGLHCTKFVESSRKRNVCCHEDPHSWKCPDGVTPLLSLPTCEKESSEEDDRENCICVNGHCCPNLLQSPFLTDVPCDPRGYPEDLVPFSGCHNGKVGVFPHDERLLNPRRRCERDPDGELSDGCGTGEMCIVLPGNAERFGCVNDPWAAGDWEYAFEGSLLAALLFAVLANYCRGWDRKVQRSLATTKTKQ